MEVSDVEQMVMACNYNVASQTEKSELLDVIAGIVDIRNYQGRFNQERWKVEIAKDDDVIVLYDKYIRGTFEDKLAEFSIVLFSLANKYKMNMKSLRLGGNPNKMDSLEELIISMLKIEMSHYRIYKKIIVLIGMLCDYCIANRIDLKWFVNKRMLINVK